MFSNTLAARSLPIRLLPIASVMFVTFLVIGMAMPALPLHVHQRLSLGAFVVGLVAGSQFTASLISRFWGGRFADMRGAKLGVLTGLLFAAGSGLIYLGSLCFLNAPVISAGILVLGRGVLGVAESFIATGILSWGLSIGGSNNAGKVMVWLGIAMYAGFAFGAPVGSALYAGDGFTAIAIATFAAPLAALAIIGPLRPIPPSTQRRPSLTKVLGAVSVPGLGLAFSSVGFGAVTIFIALVFAQHQWKSAWLAITALSIAFILARIVFGGLPDRIGGVKVALASVLVEAAGQAMIWVAPFPGLVFAGAALTGFGYSLVYPGFGVEAVRRAPAESRGLAMGAYTACLDLALGLAGPGLGLVATHAGPDDVFLVSTFVVLCSTVVAVRLLMGRDTRRSIGE